MERRSNKERILWMMSNLASNFGVCLHLANKSGDIPENPKGEKRKSPISATYVETRKYVINTIPLGKREHSNGDNSVTTKEP